MKKVKVKDINTIKMELIDKQGNRCPICGQWFGEYPMRDIVVDHDHVTGVIRGAICRNCNRAEGKVRTQCVCSKRNKTPLQWLMSLCKYLYLHSTPQTEYIHPTHKSAEEKAEVRRTKARVNYAKRKAIANLRTNKT